MNTTRNAYQLTGDVLRHASKITGVPVARLMAHAIITTDAARIVETYYTGPVSEHIADAIAGWNTDDLVAQIRSTDWS
jgi:hypothetical protein